MSELANLDAGFQDQAEQTLGQQPQREVNRHGLYCEFYLHPQLDDTESATQGRPIYKEVPYIMIMVPGDKASIIRRPVRTGQHPKHDNNRFHNEYVAFQQNQEAPLQGTPLAQWPQITRAQSMELEYLGVRTVEHLADMADGHAAQYMGMMELKNKAKRWLELAAADAPMVQMQAELEQRDNAIETMQNAMKEMQTELAELKGVKSKGD